MEYGYNPSTDPFKKTGLRHPSEDPRWGYQTPAQQQKELGAYQKAGQALLQGKAEDPMAALGQVMGGEETYSGIKGWGYKQYGDINANFRGAQRAADSVTRPVLIPESAGQPVSSSALNQAYQQAKDQAYTSYWEKLRAPYK